jgi:hypothetical protein
MWVVGVAMLDYRYVPNPALLAPYSIRPTTMLRNRFSIPTPIGRLFYPLPTPNTSLMSMTLVSCPPPAPTITLKSIQPPEPAADRTIALANPPIHLISRSTLPVIILTLRPSVTDPLPMSTTPPPYQVPNVSSLLYLLPLSEPHMIPI